MRTSQRVMLGVLGAIVVVLAASALWIKIFAPEPPALSGERSATNYDFANFRDVEVSGPWEVTIERGDAWSVSVEAPVELVDSLRVRASGDTLDLAYEGPWRFGDRDDGEGLAATITMPAVESLDISGMSLVQLSGFDGRALSVDVSGAAEIRGEASRFDELVLDASGAVNVDFDDVTVTDADIDVSGAGNVVLRMAGGRLTGDLSGATSIEYAGTVSEESLNRSGFSSVRRRGN